MMRIGQAYQRWQRHSANLLYGYSQLAQRNGTDYFLDNMLGHFEGQQQRRCTATAAQQHTAQVKCMQTSGQKMSAMVGMT